MAASGFARCRRLIRNNASASARCRRRALDALAPADVGAGFCATCQSVEVLMFDEQQNNLKAILWTTFTCVDTKTGRKKEHTPAFMEFAKSVQVHDVNIAAGQNERIKMLKSPV